MKSRVSIPGVSIWPQPKKGRRERYKITYDTGRQNAKGAAIRKTVRGSSDLSITIELAQRISNRIERKRLGLSSSSEHRRDEQADRPLSIHLTDYRDHLKHSGNTPKHVQQMYGCARAMLLGNEADPAAKPGRGVKASVAPVKLAAIATHVGDLMASKVQAQAARVLEQRSAATANRWLDAVVCFLNWGAQDGRWPEGILRGLTRYVGEKKRVRRGVSLEHLWKLLETTENGPTRGRLTGSARALIYRTCIVSGMRANECRQLRRRHLVTGSRPGIALPATVQKNRQDRFIPIPGSLMLELIEVGAVAADPESRVFDLPSDTARMLRRDLEAAGIPYLTSDGYFDFHGQRHQTGSLMLIAGANPKAVQQHMRHATFQMTMDTYAHLADGEGHKAAALLEAFGSRAAPAIAQDGEKCRQVSSSVVVGKPQNAKNPGKTEVNALEPRGIEPRFAECDSAVIKSQLSNITHLKPEAIGTRGGSGSAGGYFTFRGRILARAPRATVSRRRQASRRQVRRLMSSPLPAAPGKAVR